MADGKDHQPAAGDRVWDERRKNAGKQPNGVVDHVIEYGEDGSVCIHWYGNDPKYWDKYLLDEWEEVHTAELEPWYVVRYNSYQIRDVPDEFADLKAKVMQEYYARQKRP